MDWGSRLASKRLARALIYNNRVNCRAPLVGNDRRLEMKRAAAAALLLVLVAVFSNLAGLQAG